ncbi:Aste57867_16575 [Aphanomyces stellatus]|uniref:Aste57867_16575 protein n=1 Tax=Aphanomyces stellatus TaxID=120398 RepID=A0A485L7P2_9STRA|nr:hypothetical protein As57867_016518 [Aphanomyces stellatus]VFT93347.1 Aste57867_16575 [Aphanomyces stellatus]
MGSPELSTPFSATLHNPFEESNMGQLVLEEERSEGHVSSQVYQIYLDEAGGWCAVCARFTRGYSLVEMAPTWTWSIARDIYLATEQFGGPANLSHHRCNGSVRTTRPQTMETSSQAFLNGRDEVQELICYGLSLVELASTLHTDVSVLAGTISISEMASETARRRYGFGLPNLTRNMSTVIFIPLLGSTQPTFQLLLKTLVEKVNFDSSGPAISVDIRQSQAKTPPSMPSNSQPAPFTHPNY